MIERLRGWHPPHREVGAASRNQPKPSRDLAVTTLRLDTNRALPEALDLYRGSGWTEMERFNEDPCPAFFFEKHLRARTIVLSEV